ncbi:MAG: adenosylcobinamide-GDP ribazoletransferase [Hyphomicrobiales bacterium]|nr:adenosylcobinamide-GDP ribazoletransferase [Hyphomicrobiales bacterium]
MTPRQIAEDIALCLVFFTRLPLPSFDFRGRALAQAIWAAPLVGVAVGLAGGLAYVVALMLSVPIPVAAALALATTMLVAGCLHEDGLSDVADGFGGGRSREKKLEIMRDSRIGAYGAAALAMSMLLRWSAIAALANPFYAGTALIAAHAASRALLPLFMHALPAARSDGLSAGAGAVAANTAYVALAIGVVALLATSLGGLLASAIVLALVFFAFRALCLRQIGGQTGDTLGALQQVGEIAVLVVASAVLA